MFDHIEKKISLIRCENRFRKTRVSLEKGFGWMNLRDNDYLNLINELSVKEAASDAIQKFGTSSFGSPVVGGYLEVHKELEEVLCKWTGYPNGLLWTSGYSANRSLLSMLLKKGDLVLADHAVHRSILEGVLSTQAKLIRYRHLDHEHLEELLQNNTSENNIFVITESVFSMDGSIDDLRLIAHLKNRYSFFWIVDEAHAMGWYGPKGAGMTRYFNLQGTVDVIVGTLGKSLASQGAYTLFKNKKLRDYCVNLAPEFIYSTYLAPALAASALGAIELIQKKFFQEQDQWQQMAINVKERLKIYFPDIPVNDSPIVPLIVGDIEKLMYFHKRLYQEKMLTGCIRPPSVPVGTSRIRISLKRGTCANTLMKKMDRVLSSA